MKKPTRHSSSQSKFHVVPQGSWSYGKNLWSGGLISIVFALGFFSSPSFAQPQDESQRENVEVQKSKAENPTADAESTLKEDSGQSPQFLSVGIKGGLALPQLSSALNTNFYVHLEAAYQFPFWQSRLGVLTALGYSQPKATGTAMDSHLPGGSYDWEATQRQTTWDLGLLVKVMPSESLWNANLLFGLRTMFISTLTKGEASGEAFGEHDETATFLGFIAGLQGEYRLGPGALFGELSFASTFQDLRTTGDMTLTSMGVLLGYRLVFEL